MKNIFIEVLHTSRKPPHISFIFRVFEFSVKNFGVVETNSRTPEIAEMHPLGRMRQNQHNPVFSAGSNPVWCSAQALSSLNYWKYRFRSQSYINHLRRQILQFSEKYAVTCKGSFQ